MNEDDADDLPNGVLCAWCLARWWYTAVAHSAASVAATTAAGVSDVVVSSVCVRLCLWCLRANTLDKQLYRTHRESRLAYAGRQ